MFSERTTRVGSEPALGDVDGIAGLYRVDERHLAVDDRAVGASAELDIALVGARAEAAGDRDRGLDGHISDVGVLARIGYLTKNEERPISLDFHCYMRLADIALAKPRGDRR